MKRRGDGRIYKRKGSSQWYIQYSIRGVQHREAVGPSKAQARLRLKARLEAARLPDWVPPSFERVLVTDLLDALLLQARTLGQRSAKTLASHIRPLRSFFGGWKAAQVTSASMAQHQSERLAAGRKPGTVNHEADALRRAYRFASKQTPPLFPLSRVPAFTMLPAAPPRQGFFERAEVEALLVHVHDADLRDFIRWGWLTGMRKGERRRSPGRCSTPQATRGSCGCQERRRRTVWRGRWGWPARRARSSSAAWRPARRYPSLAGWRAR